MLCRRCCRSSRRPAFTLVELIVVIAIILVIAALAAAFIPTMSRTTRVTNAGNSIQGWLIGLKARAKRDSLPTGLRLIVDPTQPGGLVSTLQQVQQPPALGPSVPNAGFLSATPSWIVYPGSPNPNIWLLVYDTQQMDNGVDFTNGGLPPAQWLVQPSDHFIVNDGGAMRVLAVTPVGGGVSLRVTQGATFNGPTPPAVGSPITPTANWKINRAPRVLLGEPDLQMPPTVVIDTFLSQGFGATLPPAPAGTLYNGVPVTAYDVVFSPSGQILNSTGMAIFWCRDIGKTFDMSGLVSLTTQITAPGGTDDQCLVGVSPRTGDVQVRAVNGIHWINANQAVVPAGSPGAMYSPFLYLQVPYLAP